MERNLSLIKERVMYIANIKGVSKEKFAESLGMTYGSFKGQQKTRSLNSDALDKLLSMHPDVNPEWLITGQGEVLKPIELNSSVAEPTTDYQPTLSSKKGVPYFDVDFKGGFDAMSNDQTINPSFYIDFPPYNDCLAWVNVTGKSMSPFISHGDIIALKEVTNWKQFLLSGEIYALVTSEFRTIKKVRSDDDVDYFTLIPHNSSPEFTQQRLPKSLIQKVFRVKGALKKFF